MEPHHVGAERSEGGCLVFILARRHNRCRRIASCCRFATVHRADCDSWTSRDDSGDSRRKTAAALLPRLLPGGFGVEASEVRGVSSQQAVSEFGIARFSLQCCIATRVFLRNCPQSVASDSVQRPVRSPGICVSWMNRLASYGNALQARHFRTEKVFLEQIETHSRLKDGLLDRL